MIHSFVNEGQLELTGSAVMKSPGSTSKGSKFLDAKMHTFRVLKLSKTSLRDFPIICDNMDSSQYFWTDDSLYIIDSSIKNERTYMRPLVISYLKTGQLNFNQTSMGHTQPRPIPHPPKCQHRCQSQPELILCTILMGSPALGSMVHSTLPRGMPFSC